MNNLWLNHAALLSVRFGFMRPQYFHVKRTERLALPQALGSIPFPRNYFFAGSAGWALLSGLASIAWLIAEESAATMASYSKILSLSAESMILVG